MVKAILTAFHKYQPYGGRYYEPIFDYYLQTMKKYQNEFDRVYVVDSTWDIKPDRTKEFEKMTVIKVDPSLRYYDAYKKVLSQIDANLVLLMDNDMVIYRKGIIDETFRRLTKTHLLKDIDINEAGEINYKTPAHGWDVVSIYDTIGTMKVPLPDGKNKFCPYWLATRKDLLMKYLDVDWSPDAMPYTETFGLLTEAMLNDGLRPFEFEEDKSNFIYGAENAEKSKDLGYYHIRSGSVGAVLLAYREHEPEKYYDYIKHQPQSEYLRQLAWYWIMGGSIYITKEIVEEMGASYPKWLIYIEDFRKFHGLS